MAGKDPRIETLMKKLKEEMRKLERDLARLEAVSSGAAKAEVMLLRQKKDELDMELDEVERAGDEAWTTLKQGLRTKAIGLIESLERLFLKDKP